VKSRKVLFLTGSRGEYGYILPILQRMKSEPSLTPHVVATNMHLLPEFGGTLKEFAQDEIEVHETLLMSLAGYTRESMAKSLGVLIQSLVDVYMRVKPDWVLLAGDRGEQLAGAIAASYMQIPVAHVQAGELSGNIDGMARHAITKFAHLHLSSNADASQRLKRMGEEEFRIQEVGAPQLDGLIASATMTPSEIRARYGATDDKPFLLILQHPVTEEAGLSGAHMQTTLAAVQALDWNAIVIYPNNDAGSVPVQRAIESVRSPRIRVERNVSRPLYASLMAAVDAMVGNSSSGVLEAPSFGLPAVNLGRRQEGRLQGSNVINSPHDLAAIQKALQLAITSDFKKKSQAPNPYGDGRSSERIVQLLAHTPIDEKLLIKRMTY
jgi:UDP-hydrolysing UDP-N-acetyl-D-glucosamine 2-epimerase